MSALRRLMQGIACAAAATLVLGYGEASAITPQTFTHVSSGVVLIHSTCHGLQYSGSGFLVATSVVMTADHVVKGCERVRVHTTDGRWIEVNSSKKWTEHGDLDIATLRLAQDAGGRVFRFRSGQAPLGSQVAVIGHPLGQDLAETQGKVMFRSHGQIYVRVLGAEGYSGAPIVDDAGDVVAILQDGYGGKDVLGQRTAGVVSGYDFSSRWAAWRHSLCKAYPTGGIPSCGGTTASLEQSRLSRQHRLEKALKAAMSSAYAYKDGQHNLSINKVSCQLPANAGTMATCLAYFWGRVVKNTYTINGFFKVNAVLDESGKLTWKTTEQKCYDAQQFGEVIC
jgi:hypothetical protein